MSTLETIRNLELIEFERDGKFIFFHPETLCFFRVNKPAAGLIRDARQGEGNDELCRKYDIGPDQLERALTPIPRTIERQGHPLSKTDPGSLLKRPGSSAESRADGE